MNQDGMNQVSGQVDESMPPEGAIPLAPFFDMLFGDLLETEEGRLSAMVFLEENKAEVLEAFQDYIGGATGKELRSLL
jgi:hypothetical protein